jgi:hypothetical protein
MSEDSLLVRIKPDSKRKQAMIAGKTFMKDRGWYDVPSEIAEKCREERLDDDPNSPLVFDVTTREDAEKVVAVEKESKIGTVDKPNVVAPAPKEPPPARVGARGK